MRFLIISIVLVASSVKVWSTALQQSNDYSGVKLEVISIGQNTDVQIRIAHLHLSRVVVQADD